MILSPKSIVLMVHRRMFEADHPRYFIGRVDQCENGLVKVTGNTWVYDVVDGRLEQKVNQRTKIFSLSSGTIFCYELPLETNLNKLEFVHKGRSIILTDHKVLEMDISENFRTPIRLQN